MNDERAVPGADVAAPGHSTIGSSRRRWRRRVAILAVVLAVPSVWMLRQAGTALVVDEEIDRPDAIVSLASHEWERLPDAAVLARRTPTARVLLTLPIAVNAFNCHDCAHRIDRLVAAGVEKDRIEILPRRVYRTLDEAQAVREWAAQRGVRSVLVVTSPYHTRRAIESFRHVLMGTAIAVGVHPAVGSPAEPARWWRHKYDRWYVSYEWRARVFYLIRFGVRWRTGS
jgi:uncharacterized SAM-binding protein YcdF (DUF218 family)